MKKTFIIITAILSLASCSKEKQIILKAEEFLKKDLLDPKSYEVIESDLRTVYKSKHKFYNIFKGLRISTKNYTQLYKTIHKQVYTTIQHYTTMYSLLQKYIQYFTQPLNTLHNCIILYTCFFFQK